MIITSYKVLLWGTLAIALMPANAQNSDQTASPASSANAAEASVPKSVSVDSSDVGTGVCIHSENPKFAVDVRKKNARGQIVLHATITTDGRVKDVTVVSGDPTLNDAAVDAVRQERYVPSFQDGSPVESHSIIKVAYDLSKGAFRPGDASSDVPREPQEDVIEEIGHRQLFQLRDGVTFPTALHTTNPVRSEAARKMKFQGYAELGLIVGSDGRPRSIWIVRTLGGGLDERAIEAAMQWRFKPATKDGKAVAVLINLALEFRL